MKPNVKSPYFYVFLVSIIAFFGQAMIISKVLQLQIQHTDQAIGFNQPLVIISIGIGLILSGVAALSYFKTTIKEQTKRNQLLVFFITPLVLSPLIFFIISEIILLPIYGLVNVKP